MADEWRQQGEWIRFYTSERFGSALSDAITFRDTMLGDGYLKAARAYGDILSYSEGYDYANFLTALYAEVARK